MRLVRLIRALVPVAVSTITACSSSAAPDAAIPVPQRPSVSLALSTPSAHVGLDSVTLTWSSTKATSCTAQGAWTGARPTSGTTTMVPDSVGALRYELSCVGPGGASVSQPVQLTASVLTRTTCLNEHSERFWQTDATAPVLMGDLLPVNSVWSLEDTAFQAKNRLTACMTASSRRRGTISVETTWSSAASTDSINAPVFGYQSVGWGSNQDWRAGQTTTPVLPAAVSALSDSLRVSFSGITTAPGAHYRTLLILNTTPSATPDRCHMGEIDIQFDIKGLALWYGPDTTHYTLGGTEYINTSPWETITTRPSQLCPNDPTSYYQYVQLWVRPFSNSGSVLVKPVLQWLINRGVLAPTTNLMTIWFGTEIGFGTGASSFTYTVRPR